MTTLLVNYLCGTHCAEEREDDDWTTRAVVHLYRTPKKMQIQVSSISLSLFNGAIGDKPSLISMVG